MQWTSDTLEFFKIILTGSAYDESSWMTLDTRVWGEHGPPRWKRRLGQGLHRILSRRGWTLIRQNKYDDHLRDTGRDWPIVGYTMIGRQRLNHLQQCLETIHSESVPGNLIETGVWRGGACMLMKATLKALGDQQRVIYLADSFTGLPPPDNPQDGWDLSGMPYLAVSADQVRRNFERFGLWDERIKIIKGWFQDTLPTSATGPLALLRLDGDLYESTKVALHALYNRVSPGGFVIIDDYHAWPSCQRAVQEFITSLDCPVHLTEIDGTGVYWRKP